MIDFYTPQTEFENETEINRSRFICSVKHIDGEDEAKAYIAEIKKRYPLASTHCYAYIADDNGFIQKFSDAGEPQGTAGMPMLSVLKNKKCHRTVAVVTRYFGGIKLGARGLVRAFGGAVAECLDKCGLKKVEQAVNLIVYCDYDMYSKILTAIDGFGCVVLSTDFDERVKIRLTARKTDENSAMNIEKNLLNFTNGKIKIEWLSDNMRIF